VLRHRPTRPQWTYRASLPSCREWQEPRVGSVQAAFGCHRPASARPRSVVALRSFRQCREYFTDLRQDAPGRKARSRVLSGSDILGRLQQYACWAISTRSPSRLPKAEHGPRSARQQWKALILVATRMRVLNRGKSDPAIVPPRKRAKSYRIVPIGRGDP